MNATSVKTRHYAALSSRLRSLKQNLVESESQFAELAQQLQAMQRLGAYHGAQFMAVSRFVDIELEDVMKATAQAENEAEEAAEGAERQ